jgi:hypothetical protein
MEQQTYHIILIVAIVIGNVIGALIQMYFIRKLSKGRV